MNLKSRFDAIARKLYAVTAAAVAVIPAVVGAFTQDANTTRVVMEWVAGGVAGLDALLYIAQKFGFGTGVKPVAAPGAPASVTKVVDEAKTVADAAAAVEKTASTPTKTTK